MDRVFLVAHVVAATLWVGGVFMASMIDWPTVRATATDGRFPFAFVVGHGKRIFPAVYSASVLLVVSGAMLVWLHPPRESTEVILTVLKAAALATMIGFTLYGTLVSWPKLQLGTHEEAFRIYRAYMIRAYVIFGCGLFATILGVTLAHFC